MNEPKLFTNDSLPFDIFLHFFVLTISFTSLSQDVSITAGSSEVAHQLGATSATILFTASFAASFSIIAIEEQQIFLNKPSDTEGFLPSKCL
jgi:hypothetical protein